jgi:cytochrome c oxidase subunit IV
VTHQPLRLRTYVIVFVTLLALTGLTTLLAYVDLGRFNLVVALLIAAGKGFLVVLFFMHLVQTTHRTQFIAAAGIFWLALLIVLTLSDVLTRGWFEQPHGWSAVESKALFVFGWGPPSGGPFRSPAEAGRHVLHSSENH